MKQKQKQSLEKAMNKTKQQKHTRPFFASIVQTVHLFGCWNRNWNKRDWDFKLLTLVALVLLTIQCYYIVHTGPITSLHLQIVMCHEDFSERQFTLQLYWFWLYSQRHQHLVSVSEAHLTADCDRRAFSCLSADSSLCSLQVSEKRLQNVHNFTVRDSGGSFSCTLTCLHAPCDAQRRRRGPKKKRRNKPSRKRPWSPRRSRQKQNNPNQRETRWQARGLSQQRGAGRQRARRGRQSRNPRMGVMKALQCRMVRPLECLIPKQDNHATSARVLRKIRPWEYRLILVDK